MVNRMSRRGFTITEILVVVGVIVVLAGVLLTALSAVKGSGEMAKSMNRMRQIGLFMQSYSTDNREAILPSRFDYRNNPYPGKVRSETVAIGEQNTGTWSDILWTINELGVFPDQSDPSAPNYRFDSPDAALYEKLGTWDGNPLRAAAPNRDRVDGGTGPTPFGTGADEQGEPGYFAANNFFDSRDPDAGQAADQGNGFFVTGQIQAPDRSLYLIDSFAGEVIEDEEDGYDMDPLDPASPGTVDFRYNDTCLILFLDGHAAPENVFESLEDLEGAPGDSTDSGRGIRVTELTRR